MSIIYDALKKVEKSGAAGFTLEENPEEAVKKKHRAYLIYILVACAGIFIANISFKLFIDKASRNNLKPQEIVKLGVNKAQEQNLPAQIPKEEPPKKEDPPLAPVVLNGIFFSSDEGYALINNQIVKVGDTIEGATVKRIAMDEVELELNGSIIKIT